MFQSLQQGLTLHRNIPLFTIHICKAELNQLKGGLGLLGVHFTFQLCGDVVQAPIVTTRAPRMSSIVCNTAFLLQDPQHSAKARRRDGETGNCLMLLQCMSITTPHGGEEDPKTEDISKPTRTQNQVISFLCLKCQSCCRWQGSIFCLPDLAWYQHSQGVVKEISFMMAGRTRRPKCFAAIMTSALCANAGRVSMPLGSRQLEQKM